MALTKDSLAGDLYDFLVSHLADIQRAGRGQCQWVMSPGWFEEITELAASLTDIPEGFDTILGLPFDVRDGGGVPHLEQKW